MSAPSSFDPKAGLARAREEELREQFEGFPPRLLTWVGALPTWTAELGGRLGLSGGQDLTDLVQRMAAEDLIETSEILDAHGRTTESFWLRPSLRQGLGRYLQQESRAARLDEDLDDLAVAVQALNLKSATTGSIGSAQWLRIVRDYRGDPTGLVLMSDVDSLVDAGRLGDASTLVAAARGLGELASRTLFEAARRAQWRIDRAARVEHDVQRLHHYCPRPAIETAIRELAESAEVPADQWALHLLGDGGVGKTMLIRYLASGRFAAAQRMPRPFLVARADFDHLDPSYPEQRPAELLLALAADLVGVARTRELYRLLRLFQDAASALHEERAGRRSGADDADTLRRTVRHFADFVNGLDAPVLLVLDTCEELEKLYLPRAPAPAIDETFRLLELVHEEAPTVRVLFAGRRWLVPAAQRSGAGGPLLRPRPYLRVVPVAGFTEAEADAYIGDRENRRGEEVRESVPLRLAGRPGLRQALLDRSRTATRPDGSAEYSPFELASYCDWAASDPDLDAEKLRSAPGDPYVEWRIIGRLGDDNVRDALGVAAEFGRFDLALVTPALARAGIDARAAFDGLAAQEWVNIASVGEDSAPAVIEIDEHLLDRIRKVTARGPEWSPLDRRRLGEDARQVIEGGPLTSLPVETVEAAVRLLPPEQAAALWQRIEDRCCQQRAWGWAARVTERVAALEARRAEDAEAPTILAAIFATQAAATLHTAPGSDPSAAWRNAESLASRHPDPELGAILLLRARLGRLATGNLTDTAVLRDFLAPLDASRDNFISATMARYRAVAGPRATLAGAAIAAVHGCTARGQELRDSDVSRVALDFLGSLASVAGVPSASAAAKLAEAARLLWAGSPEAAAAADQAIVISDQAARGPRTEAAWADWAPPPRLADQCRLVRMIIAWRRGEEPGAVPWQEWRDDALGRMDDPDTERLAAATIRFELGHHPVSPEELTRLERLPHYIPAGRPLPWTHRQIGPLVAELAEAWRVRGDPGRGFVLLNERIDAAVAAGDDPDTIEACQLAQLRLCRRERTTEYAPVQRLSREGSPPVRGEAWLVRTLVDGEQPVSPEEAGSWFAWWRCQDIASLASLGTAIPAPPSQVAETAELADAAEYAAFPGAPPSPALIQLFRRPSAVVDPEGEFRLAALSPPGTTLPEGEVTLPPGARGRETMAAAEVTILRFPELAIGPLRDAARQLAAAGDGTGEARATLLASLAMARLGNRPGAATTWAAVAAPHLVGAGWQPRVDALEVYLSQRPLPAGRPVSPEIRLPGAAGTRQPAPVGSRSGRYWVLGLVLALAGVGGAVALLSTRPTSQASNYALTIVGVISAVAALARVPSRVLPDRFARARAVHVWQPVDGQVAAMASPSRGMRDLRGLGLATIGGALIARWPLWTMFRPWGGPWGQIRPIEPGPPAFDLAGLRLPKRGGRRRLVMLEIRAFSSPGSALPWEQWLGSSVTAEQAAALLCYRSAVGRAWMPRTDEWRAARSEIYGPLMKQTRLGEPSTNRDSFQLLHIVGTPVPTSAGWRLRVAVPSSGSQAVTRGAEAGEELLSVTNFPLTRMGLAVLQAEAVDGPPQTLEGLRDGFLGCAQDMMDGGANAVIIVPPLPNDVAREVQAYMSKLVPGRRRPLSPTGVLRTYAHVKQLVAQASPAGRASHLPVLDVLLLLRSAVRGAPSQATERST